jgi:cell division cycle protein 37
MAKSFDYSKWDNIELSDDESDLHPNIDKDSWFRLKHRTRLEREEKEDQEIIEYEKQNEIDNKRINVVRARLKGVNDADADEDAAYEDTSALEVELAELEKQIGGRNKRIAEIREKRKWNIDNICKVKEEKTIVNEIKAKPLKDEVDGVIVDEDITPAPVPMKAAAAAAAAGSTTSKAPSAASSASTSSSSSPVVAKPTAVGAPEPASTVKRERMSVISYNDYAMKHEALLEKYCEIPDLESTKEFLFKNCDVLLHEHAQSYILLSCLEDEMNGKHARMKMVCRQSQILSHIHELGTSMKRDPRDVILPFFKRIEEKEYLQGFLNAVEDFIKKIQKRAVEKRKEMDAEREQDEFEYEGEDESAVGPGGLNPFKVLKQLPTPMRKAFEQQDIPALHKAIAELDPKDAKYWMKQCVDSGLWVAKDSSIFENDEENDEEPAPESSSI